MLYYANALCIISHKAKNTDDTLNTESIFGIIERIFTMPSRW